MRQGRNTCFVFPLDDPIGAGYRATHVHTKWTVWMRTAEVSSREIFWCIYIIIIVSFYFICVYIITKYYTCKCHYISMAVMTTKFTEKGVGCDVCKQTTWCRI